MRRSKEQVVFKSIVVAVKPRSEYPASEPELFGLDDIGRVWRYCKRMDGRTTWLLTEFAERKMEWKHAL